MPPLLPSQPFIPSVITNYWHTTHTHDYDILGAYYTLIFPFDFLVAHEYFFHFNNHKIIVFMVWILSNYKSYKSPIQNIIQ